MTSAERNKKNILVVLSVVVAVGLVIPALFILVVDPFQVLHQPFFSSRLLNENQRYQNAGLINSYLSDAGEKYDSAAFGTSLSVNFTGDSLATSLHWKKTIRLFLPGGSPAEIRETVTKTLSTGRVKHLLLEMDLWNMNGDYRSADNSSFPRYLYNTKRNDDFHYFINHYVLWQSLQTVLGNADTRNGTPDMLGYWADGAWVQEQHAGLNNKERVTALAAERLNLQPWTDEKISGFHYPALDRELFPLLESLCGTDTEVVLFVPPYSMLYFLEKQEDVLSVVYEPRYILKAIDHCKNIRLHAFDVIDFTADLNNYKDHKHYLLHVSNQLLEWMGNHKYVLTLDNISVYEKQWLDKLTNKNIYSTYPNEPRI